jgi:transposase
LIEVEQWADIRRMHFIEGVAIKEIARRTGRDRKTIRKAIRSSEPPNYERTARAPSKLDPYRDQIARLLRDVDGITNTRIRELITDAGYAGGKTILDDYLRELRPSVCPKRTHQRTVYRPGELLQFDLFEPKDEIPVGHGHRCARLLQAAPRPARGDEPLSAVPGRAARDAGLGPRRRDPRRQGRTDRGLCRLLRAARGRVADPRVPRPAVQGRA